MYLFRRLSIQSKLVLMMLAVSIGSIAVIGYVGYASGKAALTHNVYNQLIGLRRVKATIVKDRLRFIREQVSSLSESEAVASAMQTFKQAFAEAGQRAILPEMDAKLRAFYHDDFLPALAKQVNGQPSLETYLPRAAATRYLQYQYIARSPDIPYGQKSRIVEVKDGSPYDVAHRRYHPFFSRFARAFGYEDLMLIDADTGDIVYTAEKTSEFATNLFSGTYADTDLGDLFRSVRKGMDRGSYKFSDFERYRPNLNQPAAFSASPIFEGNKLIGVLVLQFPIDEVNRAMTNNENWREEGLGETGEVYLVGHDYLMRSRSRQLWEDRERFFRDLRASGASEEQVESIRRAGTTILAMEVRTPAVDRGLKGREGVIVQEDYRGRPMLAAYGPLNVEGLRWAIVAEMEVYEALAPVTAFSRRVLTCAVGIILLVTMLALLLAHAFTRPIGRLAEGARQVSTGRVDVAVEVNTRDEFRALADAFNDMTRSLKEKSEQVEQKVRENEELLLNILPGPVAARMKKGDGPATERFADVTVLFAEVVGLSERADAAAANRALGLLNDLVVAFDEAAERHGVEKVKTVGASYMAVCGLSERLPDHTGRVVEFAREMQQIVHRFNQERGTALALEIGINAGPVVGGIVGRHKFIYDLWGDTVNIARGLRSNGAAPIQVTQEVRDRLRDLYEFQGPGTVEIKGKGQCPIWTLAD